MGHKDPFFKYITRAIMHADKNNYALLEKIFPHITDAHKMNRWDVAPVSSSSPLRNEKEEKPDLDFKYEYNHQPKSYYAMLMMSGSFYSNLLMAVHYADTNNRFKISTVFPERVKAYDMDDWSKAP